MNGIHRKYFQERACEGFETAARSVRKQAFSRQHHKAQLEQGLPPTHSIERKGKYLPIICAKLTVASDSFLFKLSKSLFIMLSLEMLVVLTDVPAALDLLTYI